MTSLRNRLEQAPVKASAPCRIDSGGTWDIKAMALPMNRVGPVTVNIALDLRTTVTLLPWGNGEINISSRGYPRGVTLKSDRLSFDPPFGLFFAAASYFGRDGFQADIRSRSPVRSALGGSSTALVAFIKALNRAGGTGGGARLAPREILHLAYHIEDAVSGGQCGLQDQGAAVYGGVNLWEWDYGPRGPLFRRSRLLDKKGQEGLSDRLIVAHSGRQHVSAETNRKWLQDFLSGRTRSGWIQVNRTVRRLAVALRSMAWRDAARLIQKEMEVRRDITPEALISITETLIDLAEQNGCGARFAGAGAGGAVWALGPKPNIRRLKPLWQDALRPIEGAGILDCNVDSAGVG